MSVTIGIGPNSESLPLASFDGVIGYVIAAVVKQPDGAITLERSVAVHADTFEDNELAESVVKSIEAKLNESFPDPNKAPEPKIWLPQ